ncbi:hypothetical protein L198_04176 [Cryptococcus wingfieldii CBS 7118]|uniref:N-acetyltransferase domain-containing protein n=1 Tax=Cryptococcus wingfieldii CBS 7118 TaxID=1295528 RepID=A0A1E3J6J2_9TREE|nr:hypothetical protein L198_04176 [Cryptococcus wingfieldii CBS 7118]ODN96462.1 hypothetical protein L198_04176 [Cryptococcus wingfieldii CBS 7118]
MIADVVRSKIAKCRDKTTKCIGPKVERYNTSRRPLAIRPSSPPPCPPLLSHPPPPLVYPILYTDAASVSTLIGETSAKFFAYSVTAQDLEDYLASRLSESKIKEEIQNEKNTFLVGALPSEGKEEEIKAVVHLVPDSFEPCLTLSRPIEFQRLYVHPSEHGSGLSYSLVAAAEQASRALGAESIWLGV